MVQGLGIAVGIKQSCLVSVDRQEETREKGEDETEVPRGEEKGNDKEWVKGGDRLPLIKLLNAIACVIG